MQDEDIKTYVMELSSLLNEYEKLAGMFKR